VPYTFESPLNFLMLRSDFKDFLESFYQSEALLQYALNFYIDSLFTVNQYEDTHDHRWKKQDAAYLMLKGSLQAMDKCVDVLKGYDHLIPHDSSDNLCGAGGCWFRKYGLTLITLTTFIGTIVVYFKSRIE
jgi:hypothetical protein